MINVRRNQSYCMTINETPKIANRMSTVSQMAAVIVAGNAFLR